ncbi:MAG: mechanosensitive ion channel family protein [Lachnospiraceae bacterium]|nr:mechanosensitive ion channel family protein [Lachnospiraceae bacterium]MBQ8626601.1 mechanosensitive ion channel family protein [Agathobacter sp.]
MEKQTEKNNLKTTLVSVVLLIVLGFLAKQFGVMETVGDISELFTLSVDTIVKMMLAVLLVVVVSNLIIFILSFFRTQKGRKGTLATVITSLVKYGATLLGACWALAILGVNVSTIFASVGVLALILGFGAESLIADLVTGIFILFENQYNVGDIIEVGGFRGEVAEIGIRTMSVKDGGGNIKIINNSDMKNVINRSERQSVSVTDVSVSYDTDLVALEKKLLEEILPQIKERHDDIFIGDINFVGVEQLADSGIVLRFSAPVEEVDIFNGKRILNKELKIAFDKEKINIPYPQMDIHTK